MQECLDPRLGAGIARVTVGLDDGEGLAVHDVGEKVQVETIRAAGVVAAIERVHPRHPADLVGRPQNPLRLRPIHVLEYRHVGGHRETIHRDRHGPLLAQNRRHIGIEHLVIDRVGPS